MSVEEIYRYVHWTNITACLRWPSISDFGWTFLAVSGLLMTSTTAAKRFIAWTR